MAEQTTHMRREIEEIPEAVRRFVEHPPEAIARAAAAFRARRPALVATIARGSSDHAAAFLKYAIELTLGVPVASLGPSITSIYGRELALGNAAAIAISQSGASPDIVAATAAARHGGAATLALVNTPGSPLFEAAEFAADLGVGPEQSVAATKSLVGSIVAGLVLVARWAEDAALDRALAGLPDVLSQALACDWSPLTAALDGRRSAYVLGRGPALAIAGEAALKLKETCGLHAEAYSAAEVLHGPGRIVEAGFPVLVLAARDAAEASVLEIAARLAGQGARVAITADDATSGTALPFARAGHPLTDALALSVSFYGFVEAYARHLGADPDHPPHLRKVTKTT